MGNTKESMGIATKTINRYLCLHFYIYMLPAIIILFKILGMCLIPSIITVNDLIAMLIFGFAILFAPATLWFILIKIFKNIHQLIIIPYFLIFYAIQAVTLFHALIALVVGDDLDFSLS